MHGINDRAIVFILDEKEDSFIVSYESGGLGEVPKNEVYLLNDIDFEDIIADVRLKLTTKEILPSNGGRIYYYGIYVCDLTDLPVITKTLGIDPISED